MSTSALTLTAFIAWTLALLIVMEVVRAKLVLAKRIQSNQFVPDNSNLSPFMHRLARAQANCIEGLPIFGGVLVVAMLTGKTALTDPLAPVLLAARVLQSTIHLVSVSVLAVNLRFTAFVVQMGIAAYWCFRLLVG